MSAMLVSEVLWLFCPACQPWDGHKTVGKKVRGSCARTPGLGNSEEWDGQKTLEHAGR